MVSSISTEGPAKPTKARIGTSGASDDEVACLMEVGSLVMEVVVVVEVVVEVEMISRQTRGLIDRSTG